MTAARLRKVLRAATGAILVLWILYLAAMKAGAVDRVPQRLAGLALALGLPLCALVLVAVFDVVRGRRRVAAVGEAVALSGLLLVVGAGLANWAFGVQGYVLLFEREPVRLDRPAGGAALFTGPLADRGALKLTVALGRLRLLPASSEGFRVESHLRVLDATGNEVGLDVSRGRPATFGSLVFRQGVFGFAPHLVVQQGERTLHDGRVPFRTLRQGDGAISFLGELELPQEGLKLSGAVTLADLDDEMKGHPKLEVAVEREGSPLGRGELAPGEGADLAEGYRVSFAGLRRWSEIDLSRRSYTKPIIAGFALSLLAGALWAVAVWRRW